MTRLMPLDRGTLARTPALGQGHSTPRQARKRVYGHKRPSCRCRALTLNLANPNFAVMQGCKQPAQGLGICSLHRDLSGDAGRRKNLARSCHPNDSAPKSRAVPELVRLERGLRRKPGAEDEDDELHTDAVLWDPKLQG